MRVIRPFPLKSYVVWYHPTLDKTFKTSWRGKRTNKKTVEVPNAR
jgi:hypothetical protein